ncbi:hypothetical protein Pelo_18826 [Pelomyxa schiedti]|nr:hypothetical protein Pelo_18826 [Pelomyxa schiedti]
MSLNENPGQVKRRRKEARRKKAEKRLRNLKLLVALGVILGKMSSAAATTGESQRTGNVVADTAASVATSVPLGPATTTATTSTTATASSSSTEQHHDNEDARRGEEQAAAEGEGAATATATAGAAARGAKEGGEQQQQPPAKPEEEGSAEEQHKNAEGNAETEAAPGGEEGAQENDVTPLPLTEGEAQHVEGEENIEVLPLDIPQEGAPEEQGTGEYPGDNQELADQMFQNESEVNQEEVEPAESSDQSRVTLPFSNITAHFICRKENLEGREDTKDPPKNPELTQWYLRYLLTLV